MMTFKKLISSLSLAALTLGIAFPVSAQVPGAQQQPDQVDQLTQMLGLSEEQQTEIRSIFDEINPKLQELQLEARDLQQELQELGGPGFDEEKVRKTAAKLGELTGEMNALSIILQSRVEENFTEEQRQQLEDLQQQQQGGPQPQQQQGAPQPQQQPSTDGGPDQHGRGPGDEHYGHGHP